MGWVMCGVGNGEWGVGSGEGEWGVESGEWGVCIYTTYRAGCLKTYTPPDMK